MNCGIWGGYFHRTRPSVTQNRQHDTKPPHPTSNGIMAANIDAAVSSTSTKNAYSGNIFLP
jgi:hypothetical protein